MFGRYRRRLPCNIIPMAARTPPRVEMQEPEERLSPRVKFLWRISRSLRFMLFGLPFAVAMFFFFRYTAIHLLELERGFSNALAGILAFLMALRGAVYALVWPSLEYRYFRYALREEDLLVQQGVLFRRWSAIPRNRIQHVDTHQGPLERIAGVASLRLYTAAGMSADGSIPGLENRIAETLRDALTKSQGDDGV
jgi:membrane protein YdbS with pleckstrin-like domain